MPPLLPTGGPQVGDAEFVELFDRAYSGGRPGYPLRCLRYVYAADIVPKAPPGLGYCHVPCERYMTIFDLASRRVLRVSARLLQRAVCRPHRCRTAAARMRHPPCTPRLHCAQHK